MLSVWMLPRHILFTLDIPLHHMLTKPSFDLGESNITNLSAFSVTNDNKATLNFGSYLNNTKTPHLELGLVPLSLLCTYVYNWLEMF